MMDEIVAISGYKTTTKGERPNFSLARNQKIIENNTLTVEEIAIVGEVTVPEMDRINITKGKRFIVSIHVHTKIAGIKRYSNRAK